VILRAGHGMGQLLESEFLQSGEEARQLLPAKRAKHNLGRRHRSRARAQHQDQAAQIGMINKLDRTVGGSIGRRVHVFDLGPHARSSYLFMSRVTAWR
jgi:hypothetical protein